MTKYEDAVVALDDEALTIKHYRWRNDARRIPYESITSVDRFDMGTWSGKFRVVGIGFGRPRSWFAMGRTGANRTSAIALDIGGFIQPTFVPDDPAVVERILTETADA